MGIGLLFPGQASQFPGMGKDLHDAYPAAREVFREASEALGFSVAELCFSGSEEDLRRTENTQPSIFTVSVAAYRVLEVETGIRPLCAAGHSLGEYSALAASGALSLFDAVRLLRSRGRYMQEAVPLGEGAVAAACEAAKSAGAKMVMPLPVSAPFHCSLMKPAALRLAPELQAVHPGKFAFPVVANVTAEAYPQEEGVAETLLRPIVSPVRWEGCMRRMRAMGG